MSQFQSKEQQEEFNQLIKDSIIYQLKIEATQAYIKNKIGVEFPLDTISKIINDFKYENIKSKLSSYKINSDEDTYDHLERIEEIKFIQKELWQIYDKNTANPMLQVECLSEMRKCTILLMNSYNRIFGISLKKKAISYKS